MQIYWRKLKPYKYRSEIFKNSKRKAERASIKTNKVNTVPKAFFYALFYHKE